MEHFKRDTLTGVFNRMSFFADIEDTQRGAITALCEIDMNGLKQINDSPYSCAIGLAEWNSSKSFSEIYNLADHRMYEDKKRQKNLV